MMVRSGLLGMTAAVIATSALAEQSPEQALRLLLSASDTAETVSFTEAFLEAVPPDSLREILKTLRAQIGPVTKIEMGDGTARVMTATHRVPVGIALDDRGRVSYLRIYPPERLDADLAELTAELADLGAKVSWLILRDGTVISEQGADQALSVASAFKLGVLRVLVDEIDAGRLDWSDILRVTPDLKSLPSGRMQDFPDNAPVTVHTAALAMIAESDNTATDLLIDLLDRDHIAAALGLSPARFLSTREYFALRSEPGRELLDRWQAADTGARAIAQEAAALDFGVSDLRPDASPDLGWHIPLARLCDLIGPLADLSLMRVNPGFPDPGQPPRWQSLAYKGGSDQGVVSFVVSARDRAGRRVCAALAVNDPHAVSLPKAYGAFDQVLGAVAALP